jgi:RND family efflux transporter MFP subunit
MARVSLQQKLMVLGMPPATIKKICCERSIVNIVPIESPQSGIVLERNVNMGELVDPSKALFVVDDIDNLWLVADIFEQDVEHVRTGQNIEFHVDSFPKETFRGKLDFVAGTINPETRTLAVRAVIANPNRKLKPKMFAHMTIFAEKHNVLTVPAKSVQDAGSVKVVYIPLSNGQFEERRVNVGEEAGGYVEILKGLKAGDKVVADGSFTLRSQALKQGR